MSNRSEHQQNTMGASDIGTPADGKVALEQRGSTSVVFGNFYPEDERAVAERLKESASDRMRITSSDGVSKVLRLNPIRRRVAIKDPDSGEDHYEQLEISDLNQIGPELLNQIVSVEPLLELLRSLKDIRWKCRQDGDAKADVRALVAQFSKAISE